MTRSPNRPHDVLLIAGLWLPASVWDPVVADLHRRGCPATAVSLPGQGDGAADAVLQDQIDAVLAAVDASRNPVVVGHSAACTLAWLAADARPDAVAGVVLIGGFPSSDGARYADFFPPVDGAMPFPGWEPFEGADSADLTPQLREQFVAGTIPVPAGVSQGVVRLTDERRRRTSVTMICPEFSPDDARSWVAAGDVPELAAAKAVEYVDIDSGHWPMITRPAELAALIAAAAS